ncbi:MAG TPA: AraC family transcriptional regulator [Pyrinomonadaceae bacterium]|nr:AraC family transcriptional regulator [Pyrinomonadaceae bacterium]
MKQCNRGDGNGRVLPVESISRPAEAAPACKELRKLKLSALTLTETLQSPYSRTPAHIHDQASICVTISGQGLEIIDGARVITEPGGVIMRAPGKIHSDEYGAAPHRSLMIEVEQKWLETCKHFLEVFEGYRHFADGPVSALMLRIYRESRISDSVAPVILEGLMLEVLGYASRSLIKPPVRPPGWLMEARDLLHGQFNDALNLIEIARIVGVHPTHLARTFKKHYRTTVGGYLRRLRLDWATRQLSETQAPIAEIASAAGFYDQSHFSHLFKEHTGFTPAEFRAFSTIPIKS